MIHLHRRDHPVSVMCQFFHVSRSGYYDFVRRIGRPEPDAGLGELLKEQQIHKYKNLLDRGFHSERPNSKWVTDISYIHTGQGVLYLSMIRDLYDNSIVAYKTATSQM